MLQPKLGQYLQAGQSSICHNSQGWQFLSLVYTTLLPIKNTKTQVTGSDIVTSNNLLREKCKYNLSNMEVMQNNHHTELTVLKWMVIKPEVIV